LYDCSGGFVAEDHWVFEHEGPDGAFGPVVHVAAANAGVVYGYEDIVRGLDCWEGFFFECDVIGFVEDEGEVLFALALAT
jgi:hypothetical protein